MANRARTFLGLYAGPASDGAEAALVRIAGRGEGMKVRPLAALHRPAPQELRRRLLSVQTGWADSAKGFAALRRDVAALLAETGSALLKEAGTAGRDLAAVGVCGPQTGCTAPALPASQRQAGDEAPPAMLELCEPAMVASRLGAAAVGGFAASDLAAGGVGGPVTAWPDWLVFRDDRLSRVVVRLGAVASLAFVGTAAAACEVVACDVGPGTALIDGLMARLYEQPMDGDGAAAARGSPSGALLNELQAGEFLHRAPPKLTCAGDWMGPALERVEMMAAKYLSQAVDIVATVTELTARIIARDVLGLTERPHEVVLAGGGARNIHLAGRIRSLLSPCSTYTVEHYGFDLRGYTPACLAVLAAARMDGFAAHCPAATGAASAKPLGAVVLP